MLLVAWWALAAARGALASGSGWTVAGSETLPAPAPGISIVAQTLARENGTSGGVTLHFVSFDAGVYTFRVLDQGSLGRASLQEVMVGNACLAGTNGGFFQPDFDPVGLLVCDGRLVHQVHHARLLSGALVVTGHHITLRRANEPLPGEHAQQAIQCGPFLIEDGRALAGLNNVRSARRTAVFTDGGRHWGLVVTTAVTLEEFGAILADGALWPAGLRLVRALNLDGGSSTGLWVRAALAPGNASAGAASAVPESLYLREAGIVRDFVGIVPRPAAGK